MQDDFNSSDIEFEAPATTKRAPWKGQASIEELIKQAESDRLASKKTVKQLQFGHGAPKTRDKQSLWVNRFNTFRQYTLKQSLQTPFTGDDMLRFFDSIIAKVIPCGTNKPMPNDELVTDAFKVLLAYGEFTWDEKDGFKITRRDGQRLRTFIDDAVKAKRLSKGLWRKKTWLGFVTLSRMVRTALDFFHTSGCWSWDVVVSKCLSIVLVAALGCRSGDVALTPGYTGFEYMQWEHIELYLEGEAVFLNLRAVITLQFEKGHKDVLNEEHVRYLRPLDDVDCQHVCPIALIVTHALRNGLVFGSTLQEFLDHTSAAPGRQVVWKFPQLPVVTAIARKPHRSMGLVSNILTRVYMHATRLGAVRDVAHLPKTDEGFGLTTGEVRQFMGHTAKTFANGVTEAYVGDPTREFYNDRAKNKFMSNRREPKFSDASAYAVVKAPVTSEEIRAWQDRNERLDEEHPLSKKQRMRIQNTIRRERLDLFQKTTVPEKSRADKNVAKRSILASKPVNVPTKKQSTTSIPNVQQPTKKQSTTPIPNSPRGIETDHENILDGSISDSNIDPALLDDASWEQLQVHQGDFALLQASLFISQPTNGSTESDPVNQTCSTAVTSESTVYDEQVLLEESVRLIFGAENEQPAITPESWIDRYSRINIVQNGLFGTKWSAYVDKGQPFESTIGEHSLRGNSRDDPTPYIFYCRRTDGCTYRALRKCMVEQHEAVCNEALVKAAEKGKTITERVQCTWKDCDKSFVDKVHMKRHVRGQHEWHPRPYEHDCEPLKLYQTQTSYSDHQRKVHTGRWPSRCLFPECLSQKTFNSQKTMKYHLTTQHKLADPEEHLQYMPPLPERMLWAPQTCFVGNCANVTVQNARWEMVRHLTSGIHKMTKTEANALIDKKSQLIPSTRQPRVDGVSVNRQVKRALEFEDVVDGAGAQKRMKSN